MPRDGGARRESSSGALGGRHTARDWRILTRPVSTSRLSSLTCAVGAVVGAHSSSRHPRQQEGKEKERGGEQEAPPSEKGGAQGSKRGRSPRKGAGRAKSRLVRKGERGKVVLLHRQLTSTPLCGCPCAGCRVA